MKKLLAAWLMRIGGLLSDSDPRAHYAEYIKVGLGTMSYKEWRTAKVMVLKDKHPRKLYLRILPPKLETLIITGGTVDSIIREGKYGNHLKYLDLSSCRLSTIKGLLECPKLDTVLISDNNRILIDATSPYVKAISTITVNGFNLKTGSEVFNRNLKSFHLKDTFSKVVHIDKVG